MSKDALELARLVLAGGGGYMSEAAPKLATALLKAHEALESAKHQLTNIGSSNALVDSALNGEKDE